MKKGGANREPILVYTNRPNGLDLGGIHSASQRQPQTKFGLSVKSTRGKSGRELPVFRSGGERF